MSDDYGKDQYIKACLKAGDAEAAYQQLVNSGPYRGAVRQLAKGGPDALTQDDLLKLIRAHGLRYLLDCANEELSAARETYVNSRPLLEVQV